MRRLVELLVAQDGGKHLRARLVAATYLGMGGDDPAVCDALSAAVQLLHTGLCIYDDLIDGDDVRHGRPNVIGANQDAEAKPRTLSHIVYFVPDMDRMTKFYIDRLKFVVTDKFTNTGPFLRPQSNFDHHVLFMIQTPAYMQGLEHLAFHMQGPTELMLAGSRMVKKGYESFWGPGRHKFGSNWFWYFNSPLGTHVEYDADMDLHDGEWTERETPMSAEMAQLFLFENVEKWSPGGPPPEKKD
jgi:catechol 2,3-dioxygenase-like lactoylglutathione lyase family enzyme